MTWLKEQITFPVQKIQQEWVRSFVPFSGTVDRDPIVRSGNGEPRVIVALGIRTMHGVRKQQVEFHGPPMDSALLLKPGEEVTIIGDIHIADLTTRRGTVRRRTKVVGRSVASDGVTR